MEYLDKLSTLTTVPLHTFEKLNDVINCMHSDTIVTQLLEGKSTFELKIMEGTIYLKLENDNIKYKFIPSEDFDTIIRDSILSKKSKLIETSLDRLQRSLVNTYKDIF